MRKLLVFVLILFAMLSACSNESIINTIYESEGDHWSVSINDEVIERNGKSFFRIHFKYKGNLEDLHQVERITFALGTTLGTQVKNLYDQTYKEQLVEEGQYQDEYEEQYGILIDEIKNRNSKEFIIEYDLIQNDQEFTTLNAIETDRVQIIIEWETKKNRYKDEIG